MQWRLTLDTPYDFALEQGSLKSYHSSDFRREANSHSNTWRDPVTGLVMLRPNFFDKSLYTDFKDLTNFRANTDRWAQAKKAQDLISAFTTKNTAGADPALIEISVAVAIVAITANQMKWCLESKFYLEVDEGFSVELNGLSDEMQRDEDWFCVQWDNILVHFSCAGLMRVYKWAARTNLTIAPTLVYEREFAQVSQILHKHCHFRFIPIPSRGLMLHLSHVPPENGVVASNAGVGAKQGILIPWDSYEHGGGDGISHLFERSPVRIGFNPYKHSVVGYQALRFAASGTYLDAVRDPGYKPSLAPNVVSPQVLPTIKQTATGALRNETDTADWTNGTDQRYRFKMSLTTDDTRYTPFVTGYGAFWNPVNATRNTTPLILSNTAIGTDTFQTLEFTQDCMGRFEGKFTALFSSTAAVKIAERGDATFLLENRATSGDAWTTVEGGFAVDWTINRNYASGQSYYEVTACLRDMYHRFEETHKANVESAFDTLTVAQSLNNVFLSSGFPALASVPAFANYVKVPGQVGNQQWSHAPHLGDSSDRTIKNLLLFLRRQNSEWRIRWDWANKTWILEQRARDAANYWSLKPRRSDQNAASKVWAYGDDCHIIVEPPEANVTIALGMTVVAPSGYRVKSGVLTNTDSLTNVNSVDYLGRVKLAEVVFNPITETKKLDNINRMLFAGVAYRRMYCEEINIPQYQASLVANTAVKVYDEGGNVRLDGWITKVTTHVDMNDKETMSLAVDSIWDSPL